MKKQTAIEYLLKKLIRLGDNSKILFYQKEIEQAKEMEKQQIIDAYNAGQQKEAKQAFWTKGAKYFDDTFEK